MFRIFRKSPNEVKTPSSSSYRQKLSLEDLLDALDRSIAEVRKNPSSLHNVISLFGNKLEEMGDVKSEFFRQSAAVAARSPEAGQIIEALTNYTKAENLSTEFLEKNGSMSKDLDYKQSKDLQEALNCFSGCIKCLYDKSTLTSKAVSLVMCMDKLDSKVLSEFSSRANEFMELHPETRSPIMDEIKEAAVITTKGEEIISKLTAQPEPDPASLSDPELVSQARGRSSGGM